MRGERFPSEARLRRERELAALRSGGRRLSCGPFDLYVAPSAAGRPRAGVVVPAFGRPKARRNRVRRRLWELLRREWLPRAWEAGTPVDLLLRAHRAAYDASVGELREALRGCLERSGTPGAW